MLSAVFLHLIFFKRVTIKRSIVIINFMYISKTAAFRKRTRRDLETTGLKHPLVLWQETQSLLKDIEKKMGGPVLAYFTAHDSKIHDDDVKYFYSHLKKIGHVKKIFFILISHGGSGESAWRIASLVHNFCDKLVVILPEAAASAATIFSLSADQIIMTPLSFLTAVDTSIYHPLNPKDRDNQPVYVELDEVNRSVNALLQKTASTTDDLHQIYKTVFDYIHPVAYGAIARSTTLSEMLCSDSMDLRTDKLDPQVKRKIIEHLNNNYPSHSYPIPRHKAKELNLPIEYSDGELDGLLSSFLNKYVHISKTARSYLSDTVVHTEVVNTIIESVGQRFFLQHMKERRFDSNMKDWLTFKDEIRWLAVTGSKRGDKEKIHQTLLEC